MAAAPDAWLEEGRQILARQSGASWEFADWLASESAPDIPDGDIAEAVGVSRKKINDYRAVSRAYPSGTRMPPLTFSHHRLARGLPEEDRLRLLSSAASEGWPLGRLRTEVRDATTEGKLRRQAEEIRELRRALKAARHDTRDLIARTQGQMKAERSVAAGALGRYAEAFEGLADPELLERMHGNAVHGLERAMTREAESLMTKLNAALARVDTALGAIKEAVRR